ncbi:MAG TPA: hypothetical protein VIL50_01490, partial [Candidatus Limnocylindrales bacterium]
MKSFVGLVLVTALVVGCARAPATPAPGATLARAVLAPVTFDTTAGSSSAIAAPTLAQLIGQKLVVRMDGVTPSADLLGRIRRGEVGGIVLFGSNITTRTALIALTRTLRAAAV